MENLKVATTDYRSGYLKGSWMVLKMARAMVDHWEDLKETLMENLLKVSQMDSLTEYCSGK